MFEFELHKEIENMIEVNSTKYFRVRTLEQNPFEYLVEMGYTKKSIYDTENPKRRQQGYIEKANSSPMV